MNSKARKKEKRRTQRAALQTSTAPEDAAQDAVTRSAKESSPTSPSTSPSSSWTEADTARCNDFVPFERRKMLPNAFVAATSKLLVDHGLPGVDSLEEFTILTNILIERVLPQVAQGLQDTRTAKRLGATLTKVDAKVEWLMQNSNGKLVHIHNTDREPKQGADTHPETAQDEPKQGSGKPQQQPQEGSAEDDTDQADDSTAGEKGLWDTAAEKAALEGGSVVKIFQAMKKKIKAKEKKQALIAA